MATSRDDMQEQELTFRRFDDGQSEWGTWTDKIFKEDSSYKCPTYIHRTPPCQGSCPAGEDIRGWLDIVRGIEKPTEEDMNWQEYAFRRSTTANPFPSVMGRVCPAPCEDGCNRNEVEDRVGINAVEQFIGDYALENNFTFKAADTSTGKKIAIVGGGPAGMAAAYQLRLKGHDCTIFDERKELGGMMMYGIPGYRTPRDVLHGEMNRIIDMGVEVKMETRVGRDVSVEQIEKDYDAILWAVGTHSGRQLPIEGADAPNCLTGVDFLRAFNEGRLQLVSDKVVVIGGGDTSIDVASVARRLGHISNVAEKDRPENIVMGHTAHDVASSATREGATVTLISRSPVEKMPAAEHEIEDANREGVSVQGCLSPVSVVKNAEGRATALRVVKLEDDGKTPIEGSEFDIEADLIVAAIGQKGELDGLGDLDNGNGFIDADQHFQVPGKPGHFVAGDIVRPHLLTTAIGQASIAVESIDHYLANEELGKRPKVDKHHFNLMNKLMESGLEPEEYTHANEDRGTSDGAYAVHNYEDRSKHEIIPADKLFLGHFEFTGRLKREEDVPDSQQVLGHFEERMKGLTEEQAQEEAGRCMSCGM
ncbi:MAG: FAD-dependent oxidoreductase, partial [Gammaproteobacteria bacterium]|nr:FAD-dependent oxidoreductase [Gammaproteobacteria bacterium]